MANHLRDLLGVNQLKQLSQEPLNNWASVGQNPTNLRINNLISVKGSIALKPRTTPRTGCGIPELFGEVEGCDEDDDFSSTECESLAPTFQSSENTFSEAQI